MAGKPTTHEFGKRRPAPLPEPPTALPKRSSHVALLLMGTFAVGGGAYALMGPENCQPLPPGVAQPQATCSSRGSSSGSGSSSYSRSSHYSLFGGDSSSHSSSSGASDSGSVSRGGFGSFARAFGFSGRS